jgi:hypothetical protein
MPSINSMVSSKGRLFTVEDLASAEHPALPGKQALVARDAYNGVVLWQVAFADWHPIYIRDKETPVQIQRRLAAVGDVVYCTPGYTGPITVFEAATGAIIKKYAETAGTMEFVHDRGVLFVVTGDQFDISEALLDPSRSPLKTSLFRIGVYGPTIKQSDNPKWQTPRSSERFVSPTARRSGRNLRPSTITSRRTCLWQTASSGRRRTTPRLESPRLHSACPAWELTASILRPGSWSSSLIRP